MTSRLGAICTCLALILGCAGGSTVETQRIKVGDVAPKFVLSDINTSEEFNAGKIFHGTNATVVTIWSMACPTCRDAIADVKKVYESYSRQTFAFLGVNFDTENLQGVRAFVKGEGIEFPTLWDGGRRVTKKYKALDYTFSMSILFQLQDIKFLK